MMMMMTAALSLYNSLPLRRPLNLLHSRQMRRGIRLSSEPRAAPAAARFLSQGLPVSRPAPPRSGGRRAAAPSTPGFFTLRGPTPASATATPSETKAMTTGVNRASFFAGIRTSDGGPVHRHDRAMASVRSNSPSSASTSSSLLDPVWNPTEDHRALRQTVRSFVDREVCKPVCLCFALAILFSVASRE
jgi:hypothetical protein